MPPSSESSSGSGESSITDSDWTENDGESSEYDEEAEAVPSLRDKKASVTSSVSVAFRPNQTRSKCSIYLRRPIIDHTVHPSGSIIP